MTVNLLRMFPTTARAWLVVLFVALLPAITPRIYASDEVQYFSYLRSVWFDGDVSFENEYRYFYDRGVARAEGFHETFLERETETGKRLNFGTIGSALLWSPFYAVADVAARAGLAEADGYSSPYLLAVAIGSAVYGWLALLLALSIATSVLGTPGQHPTVPLAVWFGTPLVFYMYVAPPMAHACSAFSVALFVWTWLRVRRAWTLAGFAAVGGAAALMAMVREQDVLLVVGPAVDLLWKLRGEPGFALSFLKGVAVASTAFLVGFAPQALAYWSLNGYVGPSRLVTRKMTWYAPHALQVLGSPEHGFLVWTPLALLALLGFTLLAVSSASHASTAGVSPVVVVGFVLMVASQVYVAGSVESWTVAGAFGQRRFVNLTSLLVVGVAALLSWSGTGALRRTCLAVMALCVWWNIGLMAQFGTGAMDRQRLEPWANARYTFATLPIALPTLVYRYAFDRQSFYQSAR